VQLACALLCDAASVREGLLNILGGGVTRLLRQSFPTPFGMTLALGVNLLPDEIAGTHHVEFRLYRVGHEQIAAQRLEFTLQPPAVMEPTEDGLVVFAVPLEATLPAAGIYRFEVDAENGTDVIGSTFRVVPLE
jgi:hypothetical protein